MRPTGSAAELEARRRRAAEYFQERKPLREIARAVRRQPVQREALEAAWKAGGVEALAAKPHPPRATKLSEKQKRQLIKTACSTGRWLPDFAPTCGPVRGSPRWSASDSACRTIRTIWGGSCTTWASVRRSRGWSLASKIPSRRAVAAGGLAAHQKKAQRRGASIVFIDETGFRLQPVNRRTWAPCGQTPMQRAWDRYDRLSVIGAVALSPTRRRISTPFQIHDDHVRTDEVVSFVKQLRRHWRRPLIICWDRWHVHRSAAKRTRRLAPQEHRRSSGCPPMHRN